MRRKGEKQLKSNVRYLGIDDHGNGKLFRNKRQLKKSGYTYVGKLYKRKIPTIKREDIKQEKVTEPRFNIHVEPIQLIDRPNANNTIYSKDVVSKAIDDAIKRPNGLKVCFPPPDRDSKYPLDIDPDTVIGEVSGYSIDNNSINVKIDNIGGKDGKIN